MVKLTQIENGYLVTIDKITGDEIWAFDNFSAMTDFLFKHFGEAKQQ